MVISVVGCTIRSPCARHHWNSSALRLGSRKPGPAKDGAAAISAFRSSFRQAGPVRPVYERDWVMDTLKGTGGSAHPGLANHARSFWSKPLRTTGNRTSPAVVRVSGRGRRQKSAPPTTVYSSRIWWLTAIGAKPSSSAAALKLKWRAAASRARNALSGSNLLIKVNIAEWSSPTACNLAA